MRINTGEIEWEALSDVLTPRVILTVDVEDWSHLPCDEDVHFLLDLFEKNETRATFFISGSVVARSPNLIKEIVARGHEVGSHGWTHAKLHTMSSRTFREDLSRSIEALTSATGQPVRSFRAPIFSICTETQWALDVLIECGITIDSSIFPFAGLRYGIPGFPGHPVRIIRGGGRVIEVPLSTIQLMGSAWPVAGGGYFRIMPYWLIRHAIRAVLEKSVPFVAYCHPYEFHSGLLLLRRESSPFSWWGSRKCEFKTNLLRWTMRSKTTKIVSIFKCESLQGVFHGRI